MSRMNSTSRSLRQISKQNGWDPDVIQGFGSIAPIDHARETPFEGDTGPIPAVAKDPHVTKGQGSITPHTPDPGPQEPNRRSKNADPYPGMPGAR